jgi:hypothetical protein
MALTRRRFIQSAGVTAAAVLMPSVALADDRRGPTGVKTVQSQFFAAVATDRRNSLDPGDAELWATKYLGSGRLDHETARRWRIIQDLGGRRGGGSFVRLSTDEARSHIEQSILRTRGTRRQGTESDAARWALGRLPVVCRFDLDAVPATSTYLLAA